MGARFAVLTDFDGTVTTTDVAEAILREYAEGDWWAVEERYRAGEIGSKETLRAQFEMVRAPEEELFRFVDRVAEVDPSFRAFAAYCEGEGIPLQIVSDGLDFYIERALKTMGVDLPFTANGAEIRGDRMEIIFPNAPEDCPECGQCANCKLQTVKERQAGGYRVAYVGEGHSDFWAARGADHVFAKGPLLRMCREEGLPHSPYERFRDIQDALEAGSHG